MAAPSLSRLLGAWRSLIYGKVYARDCVFARDGVTLDVSRDMFPSLCFAVRHCGELRVDVHISTDAAVVAKRLGEMLRVVALTTASHVDPSVFNALWDESGLCPMGASPCPRCDAIDRHDSRPILQLAVQGQYQIRSGVGILHDAIYNWDEATDSSAEYKQLREMLHREEEEVQEPPCVELVLVLGHVEPPFGAPPFGPPKAYDTELEVCELEALLAQRNDRLFRITRVESRDKSTSLTTTILNAGIEVNLPPFSRYPPTGALNPWQWLFDWARHSARRPVRIHQMVIVSEHTRTVAELVELLEFVRIQCDSLDFMMLRWPLHLITEDAAQKRRALEAIGATLFAPSTRVEIQKLDLDLGVLTEHDVAVLAQCVRARGDDTTGARTVPVVHSVKWEPHTTVELSIQQFASLFGAVGVRELEINVDHPGLSCRTLKTVLESCPELTNLVWGVLMCDDFSELTDATWSSDASRLCALSVTVPHGEATSVVSAMDALLTRVGMQLKGLQVWTVGGQLLSAPIADVLGARCPQLRELNLGFTDASFQDRLVQLFDEGRCGGIVELSIGFKLAEPTALFHALKNPKRAVTRTLRHLKLEMWEMYESTREEVIRSICEMLSANSVLRRAIVNGNLSVEEKAQFQLLPRQFVTILPSIRRRLALLSVTQARNSRLVKLPPDTLATIFEFAGRRTRRYAHD